MNRVHPHAVMKIVLRRLKAHGCEAHQDVPGGPTWVADCPAHENHGGPVRIDQHVDGTVTVHPCRSPNGYSHSGAEVIAALGIDDQRVIPFDRPELMFADPKRIYPKRTGPPADSYEIFEKFTAALVDGGYDDGVTPDASGARPAGRRATVTRSGSPTTPTRWAGRSSLSVARTGAHRRRSSSR